ncbi:MAG: ABC transporter ATP-binding protein [Phycisphaerales bacterium]
MIRIDSVTRTFGRARAVDDVSLNIAAGDSVALWGVNGAGKTTLIRCVLGLLRFHGHITVGGHDAGRQGKRARMLIGYVPQELGFYDDFRVDAAMNFFARLKGLRVTSIDDRLARVGLGGQHTKRIRELSGGMKQRLALAIAMLGDPPVLLLDEVTASLDACGREEFVSMLSGLSGAGRTMLFASHRVEEVTTLAQRVVVLDKGRIVGEHPASRFIAQFGAGSILHIAMSAGVRERAISVLRDSGFAPQLNGVGLLVPVPSDHKAVPLRLLSDARITVDDFDVILTTRPQADSPLRPEVHA